MTTSVLYLIFLLSIFTFSYAENNCNFLNQPICPFPPPCTKSKCSFVSSICKWTINGTCVPYNACAGKCSSSAPCELARCLLSNQTGTCAWDSSACDIVCSSLSFACPGYSNCPETGSCLTTSAGCSWTCPVDSCKDSEGHPVCSSSNSNPPASFLCPSGWNSKCVSSDKGQCQWSWNCNYQNVGTPGTYPSALCANATKTPNDDCPDKSNYTCIRSLLSNGAISPYYWYAHCPQRISLDLDSSVQLSTNCSSGSCGVSQYESSDLSCGINSASSSVCIRAGGICVSASTCLSTVSVPSCITNPCRTICYDPSWLTTSASSAPDTFNSSLINAPCPSFNCVGFCRASYMICGRKTGDSVCRFYNPDGDDDGNATCVSACAGKIVTPKNLCGGSNPCNCNYTACKFVSYSLYGATVGMCVSLDKDTDSTRGYCNSTVYVSTSLPPVCLVSQVTTVNTYVGRIVERVTSLSVNDLQAGITNAINYPDKTVSAFIATYYPQINAITLPSSFVNGSGNGTVNGFVKIGIVLSLSSSPSDSDKLTLCLIVHLLLKSSNVVDETDVLQCATVTVGTSSSSTSSSKRDVQGSSSVSVLVQTSVTNSSVSPATSPSGSPTSGPTGSPSSGPSGPTGSPSSGPTGSPSSGPTGSPSSGPTGSPSSGPTASPSSGPTNSAAIVGIVGLVMMGLLF